MTPEQVEADAALYEAISRWQTAHGHCPDDYMLIEAVVITTSQHPTSEGSSNYSIGVLPHNMPAHHQEGLMQMASHYLMGECDDD